MRRLVLGIFITAVLLLAGCKSVEIYTQPDLLKAPVNSQACSSAENSTSSSSDYVKTYEDETHKQIQYGKLSLNLDNYHIVSDTRSGNTEKFHCEIDKGESSSEAPKDIRIKEMKKTNFSNEKSAIAYLENMTSDYEELRIYKDVTDDSGIIGLYCVSGQSLSSYIVCYQNACYLVESDFSLLDDCLFKNEPVHDYVKDKIKEEYDSAKFQGTISYKKDEFEKAEYEIVQGKDGAKYSAELSRDEELQYHFTLKNEQAKNLLTLSTYGECQDVIKFIDVNIDGYADIQFLEEQGTLNNSYALYVWDDSAKNFIKVKCKEILSYFEVNDGCLLNWQKSDAGSGVIQKLVWDKNTLVKISEKPYQAN